MREDPPLDARCRDKFLVQSIAITPDKDSSNIANVVSRSADVVEFHTKWALVVERGKDIQGGNPRTKNSCCLLACPWLWRYDNSYSQHC